MGHTRSFTDIEEGKPCVLPKEEEKFFVVHEDERTCVEQEDNLESYLPRRDIDDREKHFYSAERFSPTCTIPGSDGDSSLESSLSKSDSLLSLLDQETSFFGSLQCAFCPWSTSSASKKAEPKCCERHPTRHLALILLQCIVMVHGGKRMWLRNPSNEKMCASKFVENITAPLSSHSRVSTIIVAFMYIMGLTATLQSQGCFYYIDDWNIKRTFLTACVIASKQIDDRVFTNKSWAMQSRLFSTAELNTMEIEFLKMLDYKVLPNITIFNKIVETLKQIDRPLWAVCDDYKLKVSQELAHIYGF